MKFPEEDGRVYSSGAEDGVTGLLKRPQCPRRRMRGMTRVISCSAV